jgi:predicted RNA-binding protein with RPS1 domain
MAANMSMKACVVRSNTIRNSNKFSLARPATTTRTLATTVSAAEAEASSEAATTTEAKPKRRFPKKTITVQESDLEVGKEFTGKVKSTTAYGAFVDFGAKNDGLVHISELQAGFVENVGDVVSVDQEVTIWIKSMEKGRISLTMKPPPTEAEIAQQAADQQAKFEARQAFKLQKEKQSEVAGNLKKGAVLEGCEVKSIQNYGIFVEIAEGVEGLVHISELSDDFGVEAKDVASVGDKVTVRVLGVDGSKVKLSMKEKLDLDEMASDMNIEVESSASAIQFAFKSIGLSAANFPQAKKSASASASMSTSAAPTEEPAVSS